ncbi:MAG: DUF1592 domain-containing protein [Nannocystis sp.]|nr:DUF1592 domain-containing protein [Nannocystis sp.]MBA3547136.1 DUF1592 domain-containing protein [Nannocystis sp.]
MPAPLELGNSMRRPDRALGWVTLVAVAIAGCSETAQRETATVTEASMTGPATATETATDNLPTTSVGESGDESGGEPAEDPGRVTVHRLNRTEYNNTVRDLLGTSQRPADSFPADDFGLGFDNIADVLSTSPLQAELYERAAEGLITEAMALPITEATLWKFEAEQALASVGQASGDAWNLYSNGEVYATTDIPYTGKYLFRARVWGQQAGPDLPHVNLTVDQVPVFMVDTDAVANGAKIYEIEVDLQAGVHKFAVEFTNDFYDEPNMADRNLLVDWFSVEGPQGLIQGDNEQRTRIMICDPVVDGEENCGRAILRAFVRRAWRRPPTDAEVDELFAFITEAKAAGQDFEAGLRIALQAVLISPYFVFRVELDPDPTGLVPHPIDDHELASRLSYFLWSSMPDADLYAAADQGALQDPEEIEAQALRLLDDPRAAALIDNFAGQWWLIRNVDVAFKDVLLYPQWNDEMKSSMREELRLFAETFFAGERSMLEMLTSTRTFVDERLADHYGLAGDFGPDFVEVDFGAAPFQGILNKAGLMTVLSHADHTSPVKRGKWVLENLLCQVPPPPPPGVDTKLDPIVGKTQREVLEAHREDPNCVGCHIVMDPLGFGLEHYDPLGAWRDDENGLKIDPSGTLPNGTYFADGLAMQTLISAEPDFSKCVARKTFIYALGRGTALADIPYIEAIVAGFESSEYRFSDLVLHLVTSDVFRQRRGDPSQ